MPRTLVLFAREPAREARQKGFRTGEAAQLFAVFALGWLEAARQVGARLVIATPPEDRGAWRRTFGRESDVLWIAQRGRRFGERLERAAGEAAALGGHTVCVGGDVAPRLAGLRAAFDELERGADSVLAPAPDGGVSLIGLRPTDLDLLRGIGQRRRDVFDCLSRRLAERGRRIALVGCVPDVDDRRALRLLLRGSRAFSLVPSLLRRALASFPFAALGRRQPILRGPLHGPPILRGPPALA
ncbi:MAG: DUF2064 domain-containing protein [Thermoanaerobaculia bacterium]